MLKLQVQNIGQASITIKDPQGYTDFVMDVASGVTATKNISRDLLERIEPQLKAYETPVMDSLGTTVVIGVRWTVLTDATLDGRGMPEGLAGLPALNELRAASYSTGGGGTNVVATGTGLLGNQVAATGSIQNAAGTAKIGLAATLPGAPGNDITLAIATPAGGATVVAVVGSAITVTPLAGGDTAANIIGVINADPSAKLLVQATVVTAGSFTAAVPAVKLAGGVGPGVSLVLDGTACVLSEVTNTQLTFDIPTGISAASRIVPLEYRNGPHITRLAVPVVA
jgi:hypothetical protein